MIEKLAASGRVALRGAHTARPDARGAGTDLALDVDAARDERMVVAVRHPSGAITFHPPVETERRGGARAGATHRFSVALTAGPVESALRGEAGP
ncbi:MAG: hypothetical protein LAQ30_25690 [Acidobacteriia bacterium]|nr:hypothetical protein [Terriglobia bacterium]